MLGINLTSFAGLKKINVLRTGTANILLRVLNLVPFLHDSNFSLFKNKNQNLV